jgi:hypothetical protein
MRVTMTWMGGTKMSRAREPVMVMAKATATVTVTVVVATKRHLLGVHLRVALPLLRRVEAPGAVPGVLPRGVAGHQRGERRRKGMLRGRERESKRKR